MSDQAVNIMDGLNGIGVSVLDTRECVSVPFHRDPVLYYGCISYGQHGAMCAVASNRFSLHSKGFNRTPNGDRSSTAEADAGSSGSGFTYPIFADDLGLVSLGSTQSFSFLFRYELDGHVQHGYLKLEPSVFDEKWIGVSSLRFPWIYEWVGRPFLRSWFKVIVVHSIPTPLPLPTLWSMDLLLSSGRYYLPVFAIPKLWVSDLVLHLVPTPFIGGRVQESYDGLLPPGLRTFRGVFSGTGTGRVESRVKSRVVILVPTGSDDVRIGLFSDKEDAANAYPTSFLRGSIHLGLGLHGGGKAIARALDSSWLFRGFTGALLAQTIRIGVCVPDTDLVGSGLRALVTNLGTNKLSMEFLARKKCARFQVLDIRFNDGVFSLWTLLP